MASRRRRARQEPAEKAEIWEKSSMMADFMLDCCAIIAGKARLAAYPVAFTTRREG
jgi:hypothetical protein